MPALTFANLILFAAQAALLIGALALALAGLRPSPVFRLAACRAVLLALLVLPWQVLLRTPPAAPPPVASTEAPGRAVDAVDVRAARDVPWGAIAGGVVAAGVVLRLLWLGVGLVRLSRLARQLPAAETTEEVEELQAELGTHAQVHFAPDIAQPMTFGVAPAIVLLPAALRDAAPEQRLAVICHELLHVRRRDWPWVLVEEAVLALLWFHPAVWWLVGELQLAREQVVDRLTVAATGARRAYMDALFSAADAPSAPPLLAGFLRRRHLARRLVALAEEVVMSRARLAVGGVLVLGVLAGSGAVALAAWPLAPAPRGASQQPEMAFQAKSDAPGGLEVIARADAEMPPGLSDQLTSATIMLDAVVERTGHVSSVRLVSFMARNDTTGAALSATDVQAIDAMMEKIAARQMEMTGPPHSFTDSRALTQDLETLAKAASAALRQWRFAPPAAAPAIARVTAHFNVTGGEASFGPARPLSGFAGSAASNFAGAPPLPGDVLHSGGAIKAPQKIVNVAPIYPKVAQDAGIQGVVILEVVIDPDGNVRDAFVLRSIPLLDQAALQAVAQWKYQPTLMNGAPTAVRATVTVNFTLPER